MNEDYLWNKSGEPDPEIEQLEKALGRLRYRAPAQPLPLPVISRPWFRRRLSVMSAIAAGVVALLLTGGVWLSTRPSAGSEKLHVVSGPAPRIGPIELTARTRANDGSHAAPGKIITPGSPGIIDRGIRRPRQRLARDTGTNKARLLREQQMARRGELAKEQLIKALLITSDKLNAVQKKIQGSQEREPIS